MTTLTPFGRSRDKRIAVIIGGLFSTWHIYRPLKQTLIAETGTPTYIVPVVSSDWARASVDGFAPLVRFLAHSVEQAVAQTGAERVTLIAHSLGGVLSRLYVGAGADTFAKTYRDLSFDPDVVRRVDELITLATPHNSRRENFVGFGALSFANRTYPGTYNPNVRYVSVAGKLIAGSKTGTLTERRVFTTYRGIYGRGDVWGDETIPVESALLPGAEQIILPNIRHAPSIGIKGAVWYGATPEIVSQWWPRHMQRTLAVAS